MRDLYVDGAWVPSASTAPGIPVVNPATEEVIDTVPAGVPEDVDRAVLAARRAFETWGTTTAEERGKHLSRLHEALAARADEIAAVITADMGAPITLSRRVQAALPVTVLGSFVSLLGDYEWEERVGNSLVVREPIGVVGAITPWNYPLHQVVAKVAAALAAGCTVVLKPSEVAPLASYVLAAVVDEVGLPPGVFNLVSGAGPVVGEALAAHPGVDMVSFTGSTRAGKRVAELAAGTVKKVALELGGKSANVLLDDADVALAAKVGVAYAYLNAGQTCTAWSRMLVPRSRYDEAVSLAVSAASDYQPGDPLDETTRLGPLVSLLQRDRVLSYVADGVAEGADLVLGSAAPLPGPGWFVAPVVFAGVTPAMTIAQEEIFGPVLSILPYDDEADALRIANGTPYGLAGAVWSADSERALAFARRMQAGQVDVNGGRFNPLAPFGGYKQSGLGREFGRHGLEEFLEIKSLQL